MGNTKKADFTKRFPPADPKDLPKEERELLEKQKAINEAPKEGEELKSNLSAEDQELVNATGESNAPSYQTGSGGSRARKSDFPETQFTLPGREFFAERAAESMAYWARYDHYEIEMTDGSFLKVYRVKAPKFALEGLKDLNAEIASGIDMKTDKVMNQMQVRKKEIEFDKLKWETYMRHVGTNTPVTRDEVMDAADSTVPDGIVEACIAISISKWTEAKK